MFLNAIWVRLFWTRAPGFFGLPATAPQPAERLLFRELVGRYHDLGHRVPFGAHLRYLVFASRPQQPVVQVGEQGST